MSSPSTAGALGSAGATETVGSAVFGGSICPGASNSAKSILNVDG